MNVIDLFSGVGGLSLGAIRAGFKVAGAVELDKITIEAHNRNFPNVPHLQEDISTLSGGFIRNNLKINQLCGLIGGPPCQGFSNIGKGKVDDPRNELFVHFFRLVNELRPLFFLAENVQGILNKKYNKTLQKAYNFVSKEYNLTPPMLLNVKDYGGVTSRPRVFFVGFRKDTGIKLKEDFFSPSPKTKINYIKDALIGLNGKELFTEDDQKKGLAWSKVDYQKKDSYPYTISRVIPDIGDPFALEKFKQNLVSGMLITKHTEKVIARFKNLKPGETDIISRAPKLKLDGFCPTLRAGTSSDKGSFQALRPIHPIYNRVITIREAARIQGFPDWFQFHDTKWHSFRMIGNSVNPILAEFILKKIKEALECQIQ